MSTLYEGAGNIPQQAFVQYNDPQGNKLIALNRDGTISTVGGLLVPSAGRNTGNNSGMDMISAQTVPIVHGAVNLINQNIPLQITGESEDEALLHLMCIYVTSALDGGGASGDNTLSLYLSWVDQTGTTINTLVGVVDGTDPNSQYVTITIPVFPEIDTPINVSTVYDGLLANTRFHYDISVVKMHLPLDGFTDQFVTTTGSNVPPTPLVVGKTTPIIQASETKLDSTDVTNPLSFQLPATTLYNAVMYYFPSDSSGSSSQWWHPVITWTTPEGLPATSVTSLGLGPCGNGDPTYGQSFTIPILAKGGTPIIVTGYYTVGGYPDYTGGPCTPFPIDLSLRIVVMP